MERRAIVIKGCVPGKPGSLVEVTPAKIVSGILCLHGHAHEMQLHVQQVPAFSLEV